MKRSIYLVSAFSIMLLFGFGSLCWSEGIRQPASRVAITAAGSGVNLGITRLLAEAFANQHPEITLDVPGSIGTRGAIRAVADGAIALGLVSRALKAEEAALGIAAWPYARVAIVIGTHSGVHENAITTHELNAIFKGTKTHWHWTAMESPCIAGTR